MRPDPRDELDRMLRRDRRRNQLVLGGIAVLIVVIGAIFAMPRDRLGPVWGTLERFYQIPSDDAVQTGLIVRLSDGAEIRVRAMFSDGALTLGDRLCFERTQHRLLRIYRYVRLPTARCDGM